MPWIEFALPGILLTTKFLLKLLVDRSATLPDFVLALLALPVDIVFLSASLLAGHVISLPESHMKHGLTLFIAYICLSLLIVFLWRRSDSQFTKDKYWKAFFLGLFNMLMSSASLFYLISLLTAGAAS